jgi:hypothetical protein
VINHWQWVVLAAETSALIYLNVFIMEGNYEAETTDGKGRPSTVELLIFQKSKTFFSSVETFLKQLLGYLPLDISLPLARLSLLQPCSQILD